MENINIEVLIHLVQAKPCLYAKADRNYKDVVRKENVWKKIAENLNSTGEVCEKTWRNLRDRYMRERKKHVSKPSGSSDPDLKTWAWYEDLQFLDDHISHRRRIPTNKEFVVVENLEVLAEDTSETYSQFTSNMDESLDLETGSNPFFSVPSTSTSSGLLKDSAISSPAAKKRKAERLKKKPDQEAVDTAILTTLNAINARQEVEERDFGNLVAFEVSKIADVQKRKKIKLDILKLIFED